MPKQAKIDEPHVIEACEAIRAQQKPNILKIVCEYGIPRNTLRNRVKNGAQACTARKPVNKALEGYQEEALAQWLCNIHDGYMPVTPTLLEDMANLTHTSG